MKRFINVLCIIALMPGMVCVGGGACSSTASNDVKNDDKYLPSTPEPKHFKAKPAFTTIARQSSGDAGLATARQAASPLSQETPLAKPERERERDLIMPIKKSSVSSTDGSSEEEVRARARAQTVSELQLQKSPAQVHAVPKKEVPIAEEVATSSSSDDVLADSPPERGAIAGQDVAPVIMEQSALAALPADEPIIVSAPVVDAARVKRQAAVARLVAKNAEEAAKKQQEEATSQRALLVDAQKRAMDTIVKGLSKEDLTLMRHQTTATRCAFKIDEHIYPELQEYFKNLACMQLGISQWKYTKQEEIDMLAKDAQENAAKMKPDDITQATKALKGMSLRTKRLVSGGATVVAIQDRPMAVATFRHMKATAALECMEASSPSHKEQQTKDSAGWTPKSVPAGAALKKARMKRRGKKEEEATQQPVITTRAAMLVVIDQMEAAAEQEQSSAASKMKPEEDNTQRKSSSGFDFRYTPEKS